jgi:hypothetical protein
MMSMGYTMVKHHHENDKQGDRNFYVIFKKHLVAKIIIQTNNLNEFLVQLFRNLHCYLNDSWGNELVK